MYKGFNLVLDEDQLSLFKKSGSQVTDAYCQRVQGVLESFISDTGKIDGSKLQEDWFPLIKADVFISHSHKDVGKALALAGWLKETFQLEAFIDSCVWGHSDKLLRKINDKYCRGSSGRYVYEKINRSASHVHMMLSVALGKMIDNSECLLFLNTPNAIDSQNTILETCSPWVYMEIALANIIRPKNPDRPRIFKMLVVENVKTDLKIGYKIDLTALRSVNQEKLNKWVTDYKSAGLTTQPHSLDVLYQVMS